MAIRSLFTKILVTAILFVGASLTAHVAISPSNFESNQPDQVALNVSDLLDPGQGGSGIGGPNPECTPGATKCINGKNYECVAYSCSYSLGCRGYERYIGTCSGSSSPPSGSTTPPTSGGRICTPNANMGCGFRNCGDNQHGHCNSQGTGYTCGFSPRCNPTPPPAPQVCNPNADLGCGHGSCAGNQQGKCNAAGTDYSCTVTAKCNPTPAPVPTPPVVVEPPAPVAKPVPPATPPTAQVICSVGKNLGCGYGRCGAKQQAKCNSSGTDYSCSNANECVPKSSSSSSSSVSANSRPAEDAGELPIICQPGSTLSCGYGNCKDNQTGICNADGTAYNCRDSASCVQQQTTTPPPPSRNNNIPPSNDGKTTDIDRSEIEYADPCGAKLNCPKGYACEDPNRGTCVKINNQVGGDMQFAVNHRDKNEDAQSRDKWNSNRAKAGDDDISQDNTYRGSILEETMVCYSSNNRTVRQPNLHVSVGDDNLDGVINMSDFVYEENGGIYVRLSDTYIIRLNDGESIVDCDTELPIDIFEEVGFCTEVITINFVNSDPITRDFNETQDYYLETFGENEGITNPTWSDYFRIFIIPLIYGEQIESQATEAALAAFPRSDQQVQRNTYQQVYTNRLVNHIWGQISSNRISC